MEQNIAQWVFRCGFVVLGTTKSTPRSAPGYYGGELLTRGGYTKSGAVELLLSALTLDLITCRRLLYLLVSSLFFQRNHPRLRHRTIGPLRDTTALIVFSHVRPTIKWCARSYGPADAFEPVLSLDKNCNTSSTLTTSPYFASISNRFAS